MIGTSTGKGKFAYMENTNGDGTNELLEAQAHIWNHTFNYITSMSLKCAVQLGIPDIISTHDKPLTLSELTKALSIPEVKAAHIFRLMRILVHTGFFGVQKIHEDQEGYVLTPSSKLLLKTRETNLSSFLLMMIDPVFVTPFHFMSAWFQGKESTPFVAAFGMEVWDYFGQHLDTNKFFHAAMASDTEFVMSVVVKDCKSMFEGFRSLVDVGGGTGTMAKAMSKAFPHLRCTNFDRPHVISNMQGSKNLDIVEGDMFESVPSADIILLKWIMHDWSDEECVKILKRCREAIPSKDKQGKVVIIDIVMDDKKGKQESIETQLCFDMLMMSLVTGKERTVIEWEKLFLESGFRSYKITHCLGLRSIIEVFP
ncbi:hypothetical protein IFM89_001023 [Coptis chinensis]|uniref:Uncharacterized protein n=1 Tax=Coptis chinensis TaxID=261450 RepID=A0A835GUK2_9MAGN|nr:hypothetical protein IFM89_001023 [Coptis chinensis]